MGGCFSSVDNAFEPSLHSASPTAKIVSANGSLLQYPVPITVSQVLKAEDAASTTPPSFFVCNSDRLNYDSYIPALNSDYQLEADQIYFVLPIAKLQRRLTASDMAAFAVRASLALQNASSSSSSSSEKKKDRSRRRNNNRVSPILVVKSEPRSEYDYEADFTIGPSNSLMKKTTPEKAGRLGVSRSGSVRKLQRYTSKRVLKRAVRSFKLRLTPIQEGTEVF